MIKPDGSFFREESERDPTQCAFFEKLGVCPKGDKCNKSHKLPAFPRCIILHHLFPDPEMFAKSLPGDLLGMTEYQKQNLINAFFIDVYTQLSKYGQLDDLMIASNHVDCLNGNVIALYKESDSAFLAQTALNNQYYAGRKITVTLAPMNRTSMAKCKDFPKNCINGMECPFVHPYEPNYEIYNECFPRGLKSYAEPFRQTRFKNIVDNPNSVLYGIDELTSRFKEHAPPVLPSGFPDPIKPDRKNDHY